MLHWFTTVFWVHMMTSSNGSIFCVTGHLCGEFTGRRWIPPFKGQWRGALMFSLICAWIKGWVNNREAGDLRHHRVHYDVIVMVAHTDRLLHSPSLVAPGLSGVWNMNSHWLRETWPLIGCHCCSVIVGVNIGWDCLSCSGLWAHLTRGNFHHFQRLLTLTLWAVQGDCQTYSPLAQPKEQVNLSAISVVQGDCERVYPTDNATGNTNKGTASWMVQNLLCSNVIENSTSVCVIWKSFWNSRNIFILWRLSLSQNM